MKLVRRLYRNQFAKFCVTIGFTSIIFVVATTACSGSEPTEKAKSNVGADADKLKLAPCPDSPNCVSTMADTNDDVHYMPPIPFTQSAVEAKSRLLTIIRDLPRTTVVEEGTNYLHVEVRSLIFRFVDDVKFIIDEEERVIHFRSAARLGYSDLGVNRKRMQTITEKFRQ